MASVKMVFQRLEKKYLINEAQKSELLQRASNYLTDDVFDAATVCNIYFDTDRYDLITTSLQKPPYKEKLRLRSYGVAHKDSTVYLEIKKKCKGIVNKRRISLNETEAVMLLQTGKLPHHNTQIQAEIDYFIQYYQPKPKVYIAYERSALIGKSAPDLRITFDQNIRRRYDHLDLTYETDGKTVLDDDKILMEIKVPGAYPLWLTRILSDMKLYPTSFSKYGTVFLHDMVKSKTPIIQNQDQFISNPAIQKEEAFSCLQVY